EEKEEEEEERTEREKRQKRRDRETERGPRVQLQEADGHDLQQEGADSPSIGVVQASAIQEILQKQHQRTKAGHLLNCGLYEGCGFQAPWLVYGRFCRCT